MKHLDDDPPCVMPVKGLHARNDKTSPHVIPAQAGIHLAAKVLWRSWIPALAGMTQGSFFAGTQLRDD